MDIIEEKIYFGKICPYCKKDSIYIDSKEIYGISYGMIYCCKPCKAWVGVHKSSPIIALGRLAKKELRLLKKEAHYFFDNLWQRKIIESGVKKDEARSTAYKWLSQKMKIPLEKTHIGMFNENQCKAVINLSKPYFKYLNKN